MSTHTQAERFICEFISVFREKKINQFILSIDFHASFFTNEKEYEVNPRVSYVLVDARSNYIGIWVCTREFWVGKDIDVYSIKPEEWEFMSRHDSCWRSDGMRWIFGNWCAMRDNLIGLLPKSLKKTNIHEINGCVSVKPAMCFFREVSFEVGVFKDYGYVVKDLKFN